MVGSTGRQSRAIDRRVARPIKPLRAAQKLSFHRQCVLRVSGDRHARWPAVSRSGGVQRAFVNRSRCRFALRTVCHRSVPPFQGPGRSGHSRAAASAFSAGVIRSGRIGLSNATPVRSRFRSDTRNRARPNEAKNALQLMICKPLSKVQ